jgi:hypothetical protein
MTALINASTSSGVVVTSDTSGSLAIQSNGTTKFTVASTGAYGQITSGTAAASTSGTTVLFTGIPSWVKRITIMLAGVSSSGTSNFQVQMGAGSIEATSYTSVLSAGAGAYSSTTGFLLTGVIAAALSRNGTCVLTLIGSNLWVASSVVANSDTTYTVSIGAGQKTLSGTLDRVQVTTVNGTDTFDAGTINILYEG